MHLIAVLILCRMLHIFIISFEADSNTTSPSRDNEDKRKSRVEMQKEVLITQKKVLEVWERAALQQIEVQTVQLQMLQKMSDLMKKINEKIQLIADLQNPTYP